MENLVHLWWHLQHFIGADNVSGAAYGFWSGFGSDLGEVAIIGGVIQLVRHHNCHVKGCPRVGKFQVEGTPYKVCKLHHPGTPEGDITYLHIVKAYKERKKNVTV